MSLISDAGTPLLSDPGKLLIQSCIKNSINIIPIPGASSITAAMSVSGFKDQFLFYGFLPKTENQIEKVLSSLKNINFSIIFFIPSKKLNLYLQKFKKYFFGRKILIAKEITKLHELFYRNNIDSIEMFKTPIKGELTVVISEKKTKDEININEEIILKAKKYLKKYSLRDVVELLFKTEKINKKKIYQICLKIKNDKENS